MNPNGTAGADREERLSEVLADWLEAADRGEPPDEADYLHRHPEFAEELARCFADWRRFPRPGRPAPQPPAGPEPALPERGVLGDYRIVREVGRGGMGVVYEAEQLSLRRRVALKVLPFAATMDPRHLQRFHNEAHAAASLHHEHIVPVHAIGQERGVHYYAMQFIDGQTLADVIRSRNAPAGGEAVAPVASTSPVANLTTTVGSREFCRAVARLGVEAAEALEHAHQLGIVHRDIKPANLMVDGAGKLWVTDFGLARFGPDAGLTLTGDLLGTLRYMSPEQALAKHGLVDHRTDVYSLGVTLYELLTGRPAITGDDRAEILRKIAFEEPVTPRKIDRGIPADLETIVLKALSKNPAERYAVAKDLADDLVRFLNGQAIRAKRPTLRQRLERWVRRHLSAVTAAGAVFLVATVVLAGFSVWIWRLKGEADKAATEAKTNRAKADDRRMQMQEMLVAALKDANVFVGVFEEHHRRGRSAAAAEARTRLIDIGKRAVDKPWLDAGATEGIYQICCALAWFLIQCQRYEEAEEPARLAAALAEQLLHAPPGEGTPFEFVPRGFRSVPAAGGFTLHGKVLRAAGKWDEADACFRRAIQLYDTGFGAMGRFAEESAREVESKRKVDRKQAAEILEDFMSLLTVDVYIDLARVHAGAGRADEAEAAFARALALIQRSPQDSANDQYWSCRRTAAVLQGRGDLLRGLGRHDEAGECYRQFLALRTLMAACFQKETASWELDADELAWFLATCWDERLRDYGQAEELAAEVVKERPWLHRPHVTRAIARYRAGDLQAAHDATLQASKLYEHANRDCHFCFYAAMIRWRRGEAKNAVGFYKLAVRQMTAVAPRDCGLARLRAEAAALLGQPLEPAQPAGVPPRVGQFIDSAPDFDSITPLWSWAKG